MGQDRLLGKIYVANCYTIFFFYLDGVAHSTINVKPKDELNAGTY